VSTARRGLIALAVVAVAVAAWLSPAFRAVVWDATWGNNMAAVEWGAVMGALGWAARHRIGRNLAAWWDKHHGPHAVERHKQALREHAEETRQAGTQGEDPQP